MPLRIDTATVYYAPTARRRYLTAESAARNEAKAQLRRKYPSEGRQTNDEGFTIDNGWHWSDDERLCRVFYRLWSKLLRDLRRSHGAHS